MAEEDEKEKVKEAGSTTDAAVVQIREVVKWLIGGFAAVGVALAAGSQLADLGSVEGLRLAVAIVSVVAVLAGIAGAIFFATRVLVPKPISLKQLITEASTSEIGKAVVDDPDLLLGHGKSIPDFAEKRQAVLVEEDAAWKAYEEGDKDAKPALLPRVKKAEAARKRVDGAMNWLISYARYLQVSKLFRDSLVAMFVAAAVAAAGIGGFAWAAHPEDKEDVATPVVERTPAAVVVDLSPEGEESLGDDLGEECNTNKLEAIAVSGSSEALEVVTIPSDTCELDRFVLTPDLGEADNVEEITREENRDSPIHPG